MDPNLLDPSVWDRAHIGQIQLLVGAQVKLVSLGVRKWRAEQEEENKCDHLDSDATSQLHSQDFIFPVL